MGTQIVFLYIIPRHAISRELRVRDQVGSRYADILPAKFSKFLRILTSDPHFLIPGRAQHGWTIRSFHQIGPTALTRCRSSRKPRPLA